MNIALLTIWHVKNYGAELQAYATIKLLQSLGHNVKMIDIRLSDFSYPNVKGIIGNFVSQFGPSHKKFNNFWESYIPTTKRYHTIKQLQSDPPFADIYMVGSDQVWNPDLTKEMTEVYFLNFGKDSIKRISYASSFGKNEWNHIQSKDNVKALLSRFSAVTCREQSGVDILNNTFSIKADCVIDPTLLLGDYTELIGKTKERNTLVYYPLSEDPELVQYGESLSKRLSLKSVNNKASRSFIANIEWDRVGIAEWVRNIAEAKFVITRSYHGMLFAIMHRRQFAVVHGNNGKSTRLTNILSKLGLEDRFFDSIIELDYAKPWEIRLNYDIITPKLKELQLESMNILNKMLNA